MSEGVKLKLLSLHICCPESLFQEGQGGQAVLAWRGLYPSHKRSEWQVEVHLQDHGNAFLCQCRCLVGQKALLTYGAWFKRSMSLERGTYVLYAELHS